MNFVLPLYVPNDLYNKAQEFLKEISVTTGLFTYCNVKTGVTFHGFKLVNHYPKLIIQ